MSFGLRDEDWVDPDPEPIVKCRDCEEFVPCECGCGWGWCRSNCEFREETDGC